MPLAPSLKPACLPLSRALGLFALVISQMLASGQTILQQTFNSSSSVATYVNASSPSSSQFNAITGSGGTTVSLTDIGFDTGRALVFNRSGGSGTAVLARTTDMAAQPGALRMQFKFTPGYFSSDAPGVVTFQVGSNFTSVATAESAANAAASVSVDLRATSLPGYDLWGWSGSGYSFAGFQGNGFPLVTWVVNNRAATVSYTNPNGVLTNIGPNRFDLWMGDSGLAIKVFDGVAAANSAVPLTDFKMVVTGGQAQYAMDELVIQQLATFNVGPSIVTQPTNQTVNVGSPVLFAVEANGTPPLRYQWRKANAPIANATNASYAIPSAVTNDAGNYTVVISNSVSGITSSVASLTVNLVGPSIVTQPTNITVSAGASAVFAVEAAGSPPLRYQWRKGNVSIPGETNASYLIANVDTNHAGSYSVMVTNFVNSITSAVATLTVAVNFPLGEALDAAQLTWVSGGNAPWLGQSTNTHDGLAAAQSGAIFDNQQSWMETSIVGPGTLKFWWKVSSESGYDFLEFYVNNVRQAGRISGNVDWQQLTFNLAGGANVLRWRYAKDNIFSTGQDRGWVDQVTWQPAAPPPPQLTGFGLNQEKAFQFTIQGEPDQLYRIQASSNLTDWISLSTNSSPSGVIPISDPAAINHSRRYYRAILP